MENILKWLDNTRLLNAAFLLLAVFGIVLSIYLYLKSQKKKNPLFAKRSTNIISDTIKNIGNINVLYKGVEINNLTITKVAIWNDGNETISYNDLANTDKLLIEVLEDGDIFSAEVIFQTTETNDVKIITGNRKIDIYFDYFDQYQGTVIKVIHSGKKSSDIDIKGTFKGVGAIKAMTTSPLSFIEFISLIMPFSGNRVTRPTSKFFGWFVLAIGLGGTLGAYFFTDGLAEKIIFMLFSLVYLFMGLAFIRAKSLPKGFDVFYDDK